MSKRKVEKFRLIVDGARSAALNMAVDETLMRRVREGGAPVLRFYRWSSPAVTTGYFEDVSRVARRFQAEKKGMAVVRRITGGGSVLHGNDLTFSLALRVPASYFASDVKSSYLKINEAVRVGLRERFPSLDYADCKTVPSQSSRQRERVCFDQPSCYDLLSQGKKVLGGSQRRTGGVLLHQSTLFLDGAPDELTRGIAEGFRKVWKIGLEESFLDAAELKEAEEAEKLKAGDPSWSYLPGASFLRAEAFFS
jgi:lipoyl(octanoyl) transferase